MTVPPSMAVPPASENVFLIDLGEVQPAVTDTDVTTTPNDANVFLRQIAPATARGGTRARQETIADRLAALQPSTATAFFTELVRAIESNPSLFAQVLPEVSIVILAKPALVPAAAQSNFLAILNLGQQAYFEPNIRILKACLLNQPAFVTADAVRAVMPFAAVPGGAPRLLNLLAVVLRVHEAHPTAGEIFRLFLENPEPYVADLQFYNIAYAVGRHERYYGLRPLCVSVLARGLSSGVPEIAAACYNGFCWLGCTAQELPVAMIVAAIASGYFPLEGVAALARTPDLAADSPNMIAALLAVGSQSPLTIVALCKIASTLNGAVYFLTASNWMDCSTLGLSHTFTLLLTLCQHSSIRKELLKNAQLPVFVTWLAEQGNEAELDAIGPVLRRLKLTPAIVVELDSCGFFNHFFSRCWGSELPNLIDGTILLVDNLARIAWANGFVYFIQALPYLWGRGGVEAQKALVAALALAAHQQGKAALSDPEVVAALQTSAFDPTAEQYRNHLLQFLAA
jgi:hypothetical protein